MKFIAFVIKLGVSAALIWALVAHVDFAPVGHFLKSGPGLAAIALSLAVLAGQAGLAALRLRLVMRLMDADCPMALGFSTWFISLFVGQALVTFLAGDAVRILRLSQRGFGKRASASAVLLERALGFTVLMTLALLCVPVLLRYGADGTLRAGLLTMSALCLVGIGGFLASGFVGHVVKWLVPRLHAQRVAGALVDVASAARHLSKSWGVSGAIVALSAVMHLCNALVFVIVGKAAGLDIDVLTTAIVAIPVMLIALLPIAVAGWGVREGAAVVGYGLFGVPPEIALTVSVTFGITLLIVSLPGAYCLWAGRSTTRLSDSERSELPV